jgi:hypothetical protein
VSTTEPIPEAQWNAGRYHEALDRFHKAPCDLTDEDARWLMCYAPNLANEVAQKRAAAIAERDRARPAAKPVQRESDLVTHKQLERLTDAIAETLKKTFKAFDARVKALEESGGVVAKDGVAAEHRCNALEARINALEARTVTPGVGCHWRGVWQHSLAYTEGALTTAGGSCISMSLASDSLYRHLKSFVAYYHESRTHLSLAKDAPEARPVHSPERGAVVARPQVGGLHTATSGAPPERN